MDIQERNRQIETDNETLLDALQLLNLEERKNDVLLNTIVSIETIIDKTTGSPARAIKAELAAMRVMIQVLEEKIE